MGVSDYPDPIKDSPYADDDAQDIYDGLLLYSNWHPDNIILLNQKTGQEEPNKENIKEAIQSLGAKMTANDTFLFFYSGHGEKNTDVEPIDEDDGKDEYLCCYGRRWDDWIRDDELVEWMSELPTTRIVAILEACYSGGQIKSIERNDLEPEESVGQVEEDSDGFAVDLISRIRPDDLNKTSGCVVLTSSSDRQKSHSHPIWPNSIFSYYVHKALTECPDDNKDGELSVEEIFKYVKLRTIILARLIHRKQVPQIYDSYPAGAPETGELTICIGSPSLVGINGDEKLLELEAAPIYIHSSRLFANYPNPFNPDTWIAYQIVQDALVTINIYNAKGQLIRALHLGNQSAGVYITKDKAAYWDGRDSFGEKVASGVYFYTLQAGEFRATRKMVIFK